MDDLAENEAPPGDVGRVAFLLGGDRVLRHRLTSSLDAHDMLMRGLPGAALRYLVDGLTALRRPDSLEKAFGMSLRTYQRRRDAPDQRLSQEQSGRTWKFAEILARATALLGSQPEAEHWLERPATGLDQRRPIDLLVTPAGCEMLAAFLTRLEVGVYT